MLITTEGVVIREKQVGENDKFIDILTDKYGVIEVSVKGVKKITSKNSASTQLFAYSKFCVQKRGERYYLNSSEPIHIFYDIRLDIEKFSLASYFSEVIQFAITSEEPSEEIIRLLLNSFNFLTTGERSNELLKSIFELRILSEIGMMPNIVTCNKCLTYLSEKMVFIIKDGILLCDDCFNGVESSEAIVLTPSLLHIIRYIILTEFDKLWNFKITEEAQKKLSYITENYLINHLDRNFKTLDFYKSIVLRCGEV